MHRTILLIALCLSAASVGAQAGTAAPLADDMTLGAYLDALGQIAPAARRGADAYLAAFRRRCGRPLTVIELRRAIADDAGEPVLMEMMRAASRHDTATLRRLAGSVSCARGN